MNKTIERILGYKPLTDQTIHFLKTANLYNGTGTADINFDVIIDELIKILVKAAIYDHSKADTLRNDIVQLVVRHDIDTAFKIGFMRSNLRLTIGLFKLLYNFPLKYRVIASLGVYKAVSSNIARNNYNIIK